MSEDSLPVNVRVADGFLARLLGWMGKARAPAGVALWLRPCRAVHTCLMRFPIDVVFLGADQTVLRVVNALPPWRSCWHPKARSVLEMAAGAAKACGIRAGSRLRLGVQSALMLLLSVAVALPPHAKAEASSHEVQPIRLVRPLAPETLARLVDEAESLYLARQWPRAMDAFRSITEYEPAHSLAWMRIGNLHHQRNQLTAAASAYRKAAGNQNSSASQALPSPAQGQPGSNPDPLRARALANLAAVNLELAKGALAELDALGLPAHSEARRLASAVTADIQQMRALPAQATAADGGVRTGSATLEERATPSGAATSRSDASPARERTRPDAQGVRIEYLREAPLPRARP